MQFLGSKKNQKANVTLYTQILNRTELAKNGKDSLLERESISPQNFLNHWSVFFKPWPFLSPFLLHNCLKDPLPGNFRCILNTLWGPERQCSPMQGPAADDNQPRGAFHLPISVGSHISFEKSEWELRVQMMSEMKGCSCCHSLCCGGDQKSPSWPAPRALITACISLQASVFACRRLTSSLELCLKISPVVRLIAIPPK